MGRNKDTDYRLFIIINIIVLFLLFAIMVLHGFATGLEDGRFQEYSFWRGAVVNFISLAGLWVFMDIFIFIWLKVRVKE